MWWPGRLSTSLGEHHASRATHRECAHTAQYAWRAAEGLSGGAGTLNVVVSIRASELLIARTGAGMGMSCRFLGRGQGGHDDGSACQAAGRLGGASTRGASASRERAPRPLKASRCAMAKMARGQLGGGPRRQTSVSWAVRPVGCLRKLLAVHSQQLSRLGGAVGTTASKSVAQSMTATPCGCAHMQAGAPACVQSRTMWALGCGG